MPYRTLANVIQGVVITFVDITVAKELESRLRKA
jgi:two-component system CheB/CheR fusion protein